MATKQMKKCISLKEDFVKYMGKHFRIVKLKDFKYTILK